MSRARARKQQETQQFFEENPELAPPGPEGPPEVDLSGFELVIEPGLGDVDFLGAVAENRAVLLESYNDGPVDEQRFASFELASQDGVGTTGTSIDGADTFMASRDVPGGITTLQGRTIFPPERVGVSEDALGVSSDEEIAAAGEDPFADGFDRINDDEVLLIEVGLGRDIDEMAFNFIVHEGAGTVEMLMISQGSNSGTTRIVETVEDGFTAGGLQGTFAGTGTTAYIGVTGDLEISIVGIGLDGQFFGDAV